MACCICRDKRKIDVFKTGRVSICRSCIALLNETAMTPARADEIINEHLRERLRAWDSVKLASPDDYEPWQVGSARQRYEDFTKFEDHFSAQRAGWINELVRGKYTNLLSPEQRLAIKVERAYRHDLLRKNPRRNADYPKDWKTRSWKVRRQDDDKCRLCGKTWALGVTDLHVHHIIHKANGGGHNPNNLVTLCHRHHNDEHLEQIFAAVAREPESLCPLPPLPSESESLQSPINARRSEATTRTTTKDSNTRWPSQVDERFDYRPATIPSRQALANSMHSANECTIEPYAGDGTKQVSAATVLQQPENIDNPTHHNKTDTAKPIKRDYDPDSRGSKPSLLNGSTDPEVARDGVTITVAYIEGGMRDFNAYAKAMTEDFGHAIEPYLLSLWESARNYPGVDTKGISSVEDAAKAHAAMTHPTAAPPQSSDTLFMQSAIRSDTPPVIEYSGKRRRGTFIRNLLFMIISFSIFLLLFGLPR